MRSPFPDYVLSQGYRHVVPYYQHAVCHVRGREVGLSVHQLLTQQWNLPEDYALRTIHRQGSKTDTPFPPPSPPLVPSPAQV